MNQIQSAKEKSKRTFRELGLVVFLIILMVLFQALNSTFLSWQNLSDMIRNASILAILAMGMMMVMITGGIDLSVGAVVALTGMASALVIQYHPEVGPLVAVLIGMAIGLG